MEKIKFSIYRSVDKAIGLCYHYIQKGKVGMKRVSGFIKKYVPNFTLVCFFVAMLAVITVILSSASYRAADFLNSTISTAYRFITAKLTGIFRFSLFEVFVYLALPLVVFLVFWAVRFCRTETARARYAFSLFGVVLLVYSAFAVSTSVAYNVTPLGTRLGMRATEITAENLYATAKLLLDESGTLAERLEFDENGSAVMPYSLDELSEKLALAYASLSEKHSFIPGYKTRVKPILTKGAMSSARLLGIYTFYTGEANINVDYPDVNLPFTTAHEFAHQRGIIRENEANFVAFLVCLESDDDFIRYSGYLRLYEYVASSLYKTDLELYRELISGMSDEVRIELLYEREVASKYSDGWIGKLSNKLNDFYLKANGTEGVVSYGLVTRLAVSYYQTE